MASQDVSNKIYSVATAPLWHSGRTLQKNMIQTLLALLPVVAMAV